METIYKIEKEITIDVEAIFELLKNWEIVQKETFQNEYNNHDEKDRRWIKRGIKANINVSELYKFDGEIVNVPEMKIIPDSLIVKNIKYRKVETNYNTDNDILTIHYQRPDLEEKRNTIRSVSDIFSEEQLDEILDPLLNKFHEYVNQLQK